MPSLFVLLSLLPFALIVLVAPFLTVSAVEAGGDINDDESGNSNKIKHLSDYRVNWRLTFPYSQTTYHARYTSTQYVRLVQTTSYGPPNDDNKNDDSARKEETDRDDDDEPISDSSLLKAAVIGGRKKTTHWRLMAHDLSNGNLSVDIEVYKGPQPQGCRSLLIPEGDNTTVYFGYCVFSNSGSSYAGVKVAKYSLANGGELLWTSPILRPPTGTFQSIYLNCASKDNIAAVARVYESQGSPLGIWIGINATTGNQTWVNLNLPASKCASCLAVASGSVFLVANARMWQTIHWHRTGYCPYYRNTAIYGVHAGSGTTMWNRTDNVSFGQIAASSLDGNEVLAIATAAANRSNGQSDPPGYLTTLDATTGHTTWTGTDTFFTGQASTFSSIAPLTFSRDFSQVLLTFSTSNYQIYNITLFNLLSKSVEWSNLTPSNRGGISQVYTTGIVPEVGQVITTFLGGGPYPPNGNGFGVRVVGFDYKTGQRLYLSKPATLTYNQVTPRVKVGVNPAASDEKTNKNITGRVFLVDGNRYFGALTFVPDACSTALSKSDCTSNRSTILDCAWCDSANFPSSGTCYSTHVESCVNKGSECSKRASGTIPWPHQMTRCNTVQPYMCGQSCPGSTVGCTSYGESQRCCFGAPGSMCNSSAPNCCDGQSCCSGSEYCYNGKCCTSRCCGNAFCGGQCCNSQQLCCPAGQIGCCY